VDHWTFEEGSYLKKILVSCKHACAKRKLMHTATAEKNIHEYTFSEPKKSMLYAEKKYHAYTHPKNKISSA